MILPTLIGYFKNTHLERRRRRALALWEQGEKHSVIVRVLGIAKGSFYRWRDAAMQDKDGLAPKVREHSMRLSPEQLCRLVDELQKGATAHGWSNKLRTGERVGVLIERLFHVHYAPDHVRKLLRDKLGWSSQKPERRGRERDEEEIERWRQQEFPLIKKS